MDYALAEEIFYVYIVRIICGFGILGNILNLTILARRTLSESPYTYLTAMTVSDLFVLIVIAGVGSVRCGNCVLSTEQLYKGKVYEVYAFLPLANIAASNSTFITIAIAIERFIFVRFPLLAKKFCNRRSARILLAAIFMLSSTVNFSRFFLNRVVWDMNAQRLDTISQIEFQCGFLPSGQKSILCFLQPTDHITRENALNTSTSEHNKTANPETDVKWNQTNLSWGKVTSGVDFLWINGSDYSSCLNYLDHPLGVLVDNATYVNTGFCFYPLLPHHLTCVNKKQPQNYSGNFYKSQNTSFPNYFNCVNKEFSRNFNFDKCIKPVSQITFNKCSNETWECRESELIQNTSNNFKLICAGRENRTRKVEVRVEPTSYGNVALYGYQIVVALTESVSFVLLVSFNVCLMVVLRRTHRKRQTMVASFRMAMYSRRQQRDQQRLTVTLLTITCISAVTTFTNIVNSYPVSSRLFSPSYSRFFGLLGNLTLLLSNTINFLLYALLNSRFQREFLLVYKVRLCKILEWKRRYTVPAGLMKPVEIQLSITNVSV